MIKPNLQWRKCSLDISTLRLVLERQTGLLPCHCSFLLLRTKHENGGERAVVLDGEELLGQLIGLIPRPRLL